MPAHTVQVLNTGQIKDAKIEFGDLTVLVGPQATGKSIFLQLFKLLIDAGAVLAEMKRYGLDWKKDIANFLDIYLGEGMHSIWDKRKSKILKNNEEIDLDELIKYQKRKKREKIFFIPAQRVITLGRGWPRPFTDYTPGDPFAVRDFSEKIRYLMEAGMGSGESLFPQTRRLKKAMRDALANTVFPHFELKVGKQGVQKRFVLTPQRLRLDKEPVTLPFMVWSAGQREFVPLLLGLYWLLPPTKTSTRGDIEWAIIEEIEMGLHPRAISSALLLILDLLSRGYKVCLSTHSPQVLDVVWALKTFREHDAKPDAVLDLFHIKTQRQDLWKMAAEVLKKELRVFYFDPNGKISDISNLDPGSDDSAERGWGGLTGFTEHVADVVASVVRD
jgi:hypothetical protein